MEAIATSASPLDPPGGASPHYNRSSQQRPGFGPATDSAAPSAFCEKTLHPATNPTSKTLGCPLSPRARGANPETVPVAMPRAPVRVAAMAPDSRSPTVLTFLEADRRPKPD